MEPHPLSGGETFTAARAFFTDTQQWLTSDAQKLASHLAIEMEVLTRSRELGRLLIQAHMDLRTLRELALAPPDNARDDARRKVLPLNLDTLLGTVRVHRVAWMAKAAPSIIPLDRELDMPRGLYSYALQRVVAENVETMSFERTGTALHVQGIEVPKRQREQIVVAMAQDYDDFYSERPRAANDTVDRRTLLILSADSAGVTMIPSSLRDDTRKAAERAAADFAANGSVRGDPMEPRVGHIHNHRMAVVTMVWDQPPTPRVAADILDQFQPKSLRTRDEVKLPRPQNRRVSGTLARSQLDAIRLMFDEAHARDPEHERRWVVLLDGSNSQREQVLREAHARGVNVDLMLDLIHVLHYLWTAGKVLHGGTNAASDEWVTAYVERLLTRPVAFVVSGLRKMASDRGHTPKARKALRECADYLDHNSLGADYARALAAGYPIATGNIEGACRYLIRDRMDITGARWSTATAEAVIRVRALMKSGDWDQYCLFHFSKERDRVHSSTAEAA